MEEEIKQPQLIENEPIVIQFVDNSMSDNLLRKYPDYSGFSFGFDYSQSSIWSPLVPRFSSISCLNTKSPDLGRRLSFEKISLSSKIKKKISTFGLNLSTKIKKNKNNKKMLKGNNNNNDSSSEFQSPASKKGWKKVLKMTSKQFKRKKDNHHHHHPISRVTLSDFLQSQNF